MTADKPAQVNLRTWDRNLLWLSLLGVVTLAWWYLYVLAQDMDAMDMSGTMGMQSWDAIRFLMMFVMWAVMMVGMMVPTAVRAVAIYMRVVSDAASRGRTIASTYAFVTGYVLVWTFFSVGATFLQWALDGLGQMSHDMTVSSPYVGGVILILAGIYQLTPWKNVCLRHCRTPAQFLAGKFGQRLLNGVALGARHGAYCLGCCWLLMLLLFVGGVMNLLWIAAITVFVLGEKLLPVAIQATRVAAVAMIVAGTVFLFAA